ncbi:sensor histidine kinase [Larkinella sp. VNQ87]|uniref:sensor histidine kinase n=1 Tax=Larkinella sp. VNQ87 TaxID=3400921 RepID=UPI003BFD3DF2
MRVLPYDQSYTNWFFRYKLYHLPFWFLYHYLWWVIGLGNPAKALNTLFVLPYAIKYSFYVLFQALAVYFNLYYLIPTYLEKSRFFRYGFYLALTISVATLCTVSGYYFSAYVSGRTLAELYGGSTESNCFYRFVGNALPSTVASMTLAMSIKLTKNWIQTERRQQLLEKEKLETELKFLKNQFNPHFLFNTINSIFFLIHKNPDMASASLAKFSELLRYQLYECNDQQISLDKEISYLENFIELEKLRQNQNIEVVFESQAGFSDHLGISPFILMAFVENAFKHVSRQPDRTNWIEIRLSVVGQQLDFFVANSTAPQQTRELIHYGGIGLKNVQRRLDLLYPAQHELVIQPSPTDFTIHLRLHLSASVPAPILQPV